MKRVFCLLLLAAPVAMLVSSDCFARGGGGGRVGGGGGGGRVGGGGGGARPSVGGGGGSRPSMGGGGARPSFGGGGGSMHTPSMSRPTGSPVSSRPSMPQMQRPSTGGRPTTLPSGGSRPNVAGGRPSTLPGSRPSFGGGNSPGIGGPNTGGGIGGPNIGANRPGIGGGNQSPPFTRPGIGNNPIAGGGRPSQGDLKDFLDLPGSAGGGRPDIANRPNIDNRPGIDNRPNINRPDIGDKIGNNTNIGDRTNIGNKINTGDININAGNKIGINNRQNNVNSIRNKYNNVGQRPFDRGYWNGNHIGDNNWRWNNGWNRYPNNWCWRPAAWASFGTFFAWSWAQPYNYDYGTNVVYRDNYIYVDDKQYATADQYYQQADTIAESVPQNVDEAKVEWMPLGVFAIAEEGAEDTDNLVQLAVSKEGIIAGTFYNETTGTDRPLEGMVDQKSQRAAWKFADGKNPEVIMETGIYNLTKDEATALIHFGEDKTQTWLMVRLQEPEADAQGATVAPPAAGVQP